jgi:hypothetical protein
MNDEIFIGKLITHSEMVIPQGGMVDPWEELEIERMPHPIHSSQGYLYA